MSNKIVITQYRYFKFQEHKSKCNEVSQYVLQCHSKNIQMAHRKCIVQQIFRNFKIDINSKD